MVGQLSTLPSTTRCTVFLSPPKVPVSGETSLATIQSQPFLSRLAAAFSMMSSVSAAKPMTRGERMSPALLRLWRMSGFSANLRVGGLPPAFLSFCSAGSTTRQSLTAAAQTATSTGSTVRQAASMSSAETMRITLTPGGSGSWVGPVTRMVSAPSRASAAATAWPCLPDERLVI